MNVMRLGSDYEVVPAAFRRRFTTSKVNNSLVKSWQKGKSRDPSVRSSSLLRGKRAYNMDGRRGRRGRSIENSFEEET